jgi:hypothetical protein
MILQKMKKYKFQILIRIHIGTRQASLENRDNYGELQTYKKERIWTMKNNLI